MTRVGGFFALFVVLKYLGVSNLAQAQDVSALREAVATAAENAAASAQQCAALVRDVDSPVGISVEQVPDTAADTAVNDDADEGLHEGRMATDDNHHSGKYDAPCSVDVAGLGGSTTLCFEDDGQDISDLLVVKSPGSDQRDVLASASAQIAPIVDGNGDSPNLPVVLPPHAAAEKGPEQDDGPEGTEVESQRLPNQDEAFTKGDHPEEEAMTNGLSRPSSSSQIGARHVATHDEPRVRGDSAPGAPASAASDMLSWVNYKHLGIAVVGLLLLVLTVKSRVGMKVAAVAMLAMSLARGRVPHGRAADPRYRHPSRVGRVVLVVKIAMVDGPRALVSWVSERDWVRSTSAWTGGIRTYVALAAFGMLRSDVTSRIENWVASLLTRGFSVVRNQVSRARAVDSLTWLSIVEETWMSLSVVILAATSKITPIDGSSPYMKVMSKSDMAKWNAWWYDYRWVVVGMLMPLFLGVMRMVTKDIVSMTLLAMCRVRGRLPQGRAATPYHWHTMRPAVVAVVAKIVVVDGLGGLVWWVSEQVAANFVSGWREVFCWSVVLGSGAYMRSYTLDVISSITNGMVAVGTWVYSTIFHKGSPGRGAEPPCWHPFRAVTAVLTLGLVAMVVAGIAETDGWSASVVWASRGVTVFRSRLPLTFQLVSVSWKTLGVAATAAGLMAWVMVVYVAAAGLFFVCTNRMTFPIRILVRIFELYDKWGEPNTVQLRDDLVGRIYLMLVLPRRLRSFGLNQLCGNMKLALHVGLHRNVLWQAYGTNASLKAAVFSVLSRLEPGDDYTQVLLVARSLQDVFDLSARFQTFADVTGTTITVLKALGSHWEEEVQAQVVIGTASTLSILLDRAIVNPANVQAFVVHLGYDESTTSQKDPLESIEAPCLSIKRMLPGTCQSMVFAGGYCRGVNDFATGLAPSPSVFRSLNLNARPDIIRSYIDSLEDDDFRNEATTYLGNDALLQTRAANRLQICLKLLSATPGLQEKPCSLGRALFSAWAFTAVWYAGQWVMPLALPSLTSSAPAFVRVLSSFVCGLPAATAELLDWLFYLLIVVVTATAELFGWLVVVLVVMVAVTLKLLDWLLYVLFVVVFIELITGLCARVCDLVWLLKVFASCFWAELTVISFTSRLLWFYFRRK